MIGHGASVTKSRVYVSLRRGRCRERGRKAVGGHQRTFRGQAETLIPNADFLDREGKSSGKLLHVIPFVVNFGRTFSPRNLAQI